MRLELYKICKRKGHFYSSFFKKKTLFFVSFVSFLSWCYPNKCRVVYSSIVTKAWQEAIKKIVHRKTYVRCNNFCIFQVQLGGYATVYGRKMRDWKKKMEERSTEQTNRTAIKTANSEERGRQSDRKREMSKGAIVSSQERDGRRAKVGKE